MNQKNMNMAKGILVALVVLLVVGLSVSILKTSKIAATNTIHLGIIGDSVSDEYRADDNRGGSYSATTFNWVELLQRYRGIDVGTWGTYASPRRTGYAYNWALSGSTSVDAVNLEMSGLAQQVSTGQVNTVLIETGINDFGGIVDQIYAGTLSGSALQQTINSIVSNIMTSADTIRSAGNVNMIVSNIPDYFTYFYASQYSDPVKRQRIVNAITTANSAIASGISARPGVAFFDHYTLVANWISSLSNGNMQVGNQLISWTTNGDEPHHFFVLDGHPGTVAGGLYANALFINVMNSAFGTSLVPFSDQEILTNAGVTPTDATPPIITAVSALSITSNSALITWTTNESADTQVYYGTTASYGSQTALNTNKVTSHSQTLSGLSPSTTYHYQVRSSDAAGNLATLGDYTFTTQAPPDTTAPVISAISASSITSSGAKISWTTNEASTTQIEYGTTISYGKSTTLNSSMVTAHSQTLSGLYSLTLYHYRVKSKDAAGNLATSGDYTLTTLVAPDTTAPTVSITAPVNNSVVSATVNITATASDNVGVVGVQFKLDGANLGSEDTISPYSYSWNTVSSFDGGHTLTATARDVAGNTKTSTVTVTVNNGGDTTPPVISAISASSITSSGAKISWTTNELSNTQIEYGTTTSYGKSTILNTSMVTSHSQTLSGLYSSTLYHYRVKSRDVAGNLATSGDYMFTTARRW